MKFKDNLTIHVGCEKYELILDKKCSGGVSLSKVNDTVEEILEQTGFKEFFAIK